MREKKAENPGLRLAFFFSDSRPLALKSSSKSHQMITFLVQNDDVFINTTSFISQFSCWMKKAVIWWLVNDVEVESKRKKEPENPGLKYF